MTSVLVSAFGFAETFFGFHYLRETVFNANNPLMTQFSQITNQRAISTIGNPIPLGSYLSLCCPFLLFGFWNGKSRNKRIAAAGGFLLVICVLYLTFSRGAWIAFFVSTLVVLIPHRRKYLIVWALGILIFAIATPKDGKLNDRNLYTQYVENFHLSHRTKSFDIAVTIWASRPLLGVGLGEYGHLARPMGSENDIPDNMYLLTLAEVGILGLAVRLWMFFFLLRGLFRTYRLLDDRFLALAVQQKNKRFVSLGIDLKHTFEGREIIHDRDLVLVFLASFVGFFVNMLSWDALYFPVTRIVFWLLAGLAFVHICNIKETSERLVGNR